jgi:ABC-type transporter Mla MlaB component
MSQGSVPQQRNGTVIKNPEGHTLTVGPSARIEDSETLAAQMKALVQGDAPVVDVDVTAVESVDVSFFQLLLAFQRSLADQRRQLTVLPISEDHAVARTGRLLGLPLEYYLTFSKAMP